MEIENKPIRQGDVWLQPSTIPRGAGPLPDKAGVHVLAEGEQSGHLHAVDATRAQLLRDGAVLFLRVTKPVELRHGNPLHAWKGDHDTLKVPVGDYRVIIERDYEPGSWRQVVD